MTSPIDVPAPDAYEDVGSAPDGRPLRPAVRALLVDPAGAVLLVRFEFASEGTVWAMPGGGVDPGETPVEALRRELHEEVGLTEPSIGPMIWHFSRIVPQMRDWGGQVDRVYLVETPRFDPQPMMTWEQLNAEQLFELRWWTPAELLAADRAGTLFAPRGLAGLVASLQAAGPPPSTLIVEG